MICRPSAGRGRSAGWRDYNRRTQWVRLIAANGEVLMHSEIYETPSNARRAKADIEAAMVDYLESRGYVVAKAER